MTVRNINYRYIFHHAITNVYLGEFILKDVKFNSPLLGAGGQFSGIIPINQNQPASVVKPATELDDVAVYVIYKDPDTGVETFLWGGPIIARLWKSKTLEVSITAVEWKSWFYTRMFAPAITAPFADRKLIYTATDQLVIARALLAEAVNLPGTPTLVIGTETSTRTRDLSVIGSKFRQIGDWVDSMAFRTDGFDWTINIRKSAVSRSPELVAGLYYPEKGAINNALTLDYVGNVLDRTQDGRGTIQDIGDWPEDVSQRRTRIWATGDGTPPDQPLAMDDDPGIDTDEVLLRETQINLSGVVKPSTLSEHAQAERKVLGVTTESIEVGVKTSAIKPTSVNTGDRINLKVQDEWLDIDMASVRIVDRAIEPHGSDGEQITLTLDLSDFERPDLDEGDTV
jgi:hypothetical protein